MTIRTKLSRAVLGSALASALLIFAVPAATAAPGSTTPGSTTTGSTTTDSSTTGSSTTGSSTAADYTRATTSKPLSSTRNIPKDDLYAHFLLINFTGYRLKVHDVHDYVQDYTKKPIFPGVNEVVPTGGFDLYGWGIAAKKYGAGHYLVQNPDGSQVGDFTVEFDQDSAQFQSQDPADRFSIEVDQRRVDGQLYTAVVVYPTHEGSQTIDAAATPAQTLTDLIDWQTDELTFAYSADKTERTYGPPHPMPSEDNHDNPGGTPSTFDFSASETDEGKTGWGVKYSASMKQIIEVSVEGSIETSWTESRKFEQAVTAVVQPQHRVVLSAQSPVIQQTGTLTIKFKNQTWTVINAVMTVIDNNPDRAQVINFVETPM
jgi:hypothetical protein